MSTPPERLYSESHEWYHIEGETVTIGITQYAANELTDITYIEMQPPGTSINAGDSVGEVESVKTTSDVFCPFSGDVSEVNSEAAGNPAVLNQDPYGDGWLVRLKVADASKPDSLMDQSTYDDRYPLN